MARRAHKIDLPVSEIRRYLEPGPIVLVSSAHGGKRNIMTMGWHTVMEFTPSLVVLAISLLLRRSLRDGRRRQKRETIEDDETRDQFQLVFRNLISHGRAPSFLIYTVRFGLNKMQPSHLRLPDKRRHA